MQIPLYSNLSDFEKFYMKDFSNQEDFKYLDFLINQSDLYNTLVQNFIDVGASKINHTAIEKERLDLYDKTNNSVNKVLEIIRFIEIEKIKYSESLKSNIKSENTEIPENDFSEIETIEKTKIKVEMIIFKELGIIDLLTKTQKLKNSETAKRLNYLLKDKLENAKIKDPQNYIENILTAIAIGKPQIKIDKTPYKKQNIKDALIYLTNMGLSIEDTIYLKDLKHTHSYLFD